MTEWDKHGTAHLAEYVDTRGEDESEILELQRVEIRKGIPPETVEVTYALTIYDGKEDMTFHGMTARKVCEVAEDMIRLVGGRLRVDPPPPPEIKF